MRMVIDGGPAQTKGISVQEPSQTKFLDMDEGEVTQLDVPSKPDLLEWGQVLIGGIKNRSHALESGGCSSFQEKSQPWKEAGVELHGQELVPFDMPLGPVPEDLEVILHVGIRVGVNVPAGISKEGLRAEEPGGKVWVIKQWHRERDNIPLLIHGFVICQANILNG